MLVELSLLAGEAFGDVNMNGNGQIAPATAGRLALTSEPEGLSFGGADWQIQLQLVAKLGPKANFIAQHRLGNTNLKLNLNLGEGRLEQVLKYRTDPAAGAAEIDVDPFWAKVPEIKSLKTAKSGPGPTASGRSRTANRAKLVILGPLLGVAQHLIGLVQLLEGRFIAPFVGVELMGLLSIGLFDLPLVGGTGNTQNLIEISSH